MDFVKVNIKSFKKLSIEYTFFFTLHTRAHPMDYAIKKFETMLHKIANIQVTVTGHNPKCNRMHVISRSIYYLTLDVLCNLNWVVIFFFFFFFGLYIKLLFLEFIILYGENVPGCRYRRIKTIPLLKCFIVNNFKYI